MKFFHNPRRKSGRRRKRRTAAQRRATAKMIAANRRRRRGGKPKRRRRTTTVRRRRLTATTTRRRRPAMARKRRRRATARRRTSRRRRRSSGTIRFRRVRGAVYARNPNILTMLTRGVMDAATVVGGKAVSGFIGSKIPQFVPGALGGTLNRLVAAVGVGFLASRFLSADRARLAVAGALAAPIETAIKAANIPLLSEGLSDDDDYYQVDMEGYPALQGYPAVASVAGVGETDEDYEYAY